MRKDIHQTLIRLGLKDNEINVFLTCVGNEGLFAQEIAKAADIKRSTVDLVLSRLINDGYLTRQKIGARYMYRAQNPESILYKKLQLLEDFKGIIPVLSQMSGQDNQTDVRFFEGAEGIRQLYLDGLRRLSILPPEERKIYAFVSQNDILKVLPDFLNFFVKKQKANRIPAYLICPEAVKNLQTQQHEPESLRFIKYFDDEILPYNISIEMFGNDYVGIFSIAPPIRGIVIKDEIMCKSLQSLFTAFWKLLPAEHHKDEIILV